MMALMKTMVMMVDNHIWKTVAERKAVYEYYWHILFINENTWAYLIKNKLYLFRSGL